MATNGPGQKENKNNAERATTSNG